jgi:bacteriorhodopsin
VDVSQEIIERLVRLETKLDGFNQYKETATNAHNMAIQNGKDIAEIKDNQKWLWRSIAGAIIAGIIAMYLKGKGMY